METDRERPARRVCVSCEGEHDEGKHSLPEPMTPFGVTTEHHARSVWGGPSVGCTGCDFIGASWDEHPAEATERPDLRAALTKLIAAQDVNASVGERIAATAQAQRELNRWNDARPESGATATGLSAMSAPSVTRSGDGSTVCPRCHHESHWHESGGCVATYKTVDGETPCRCRAALTGASPSEPQPAPPLDVDTLLRYGRHEEGCPDYFTEPPWQSCHCGWAEVLARLGSAPSTQEKGDD